MKLSASIALRPIFSFVVLVFIVLLIPILVISVWYALSERVEEAAKFASYYVHSKTFLDIETTASLLFPTNSSALKLARVLSSSLNANQMSLSAFETQVAPSMFLVFSTLPLSQISYIQPNSLFFSYYNEGNQTFVVYSNNSFIKTTPNSSIVYYCYSQLVDKKTGMRYGETSILNTTISIDSSWFHRALNSANGYASLGKGWGKTRERLFLGTAAIDGGGVVSLGFPVKTFNDAISRIDHHLGDLYLVTKHGILLTQTGPFSIVLYNNTVSAQLNKSNGDLAGEAVNISCEPNENPLRASNSSIVGAKYLFYCAPLEIAGVEMISLVAFPHKGFLKLVHKHSKLAFVLLFLMLASVILSISFFVYLIFRTARKEMFLCAALIKQMEVTRQAERKSVNKSLAFINASHDVRSSLATLDGLIVLCSTNVAPQSMLHMNLEHMRVSASDLIRILNSVLDTSETEAGNLELEEDEFDFAQVLEESVNLFYPIGMSKGIDVVLDPCDGSILKHSLVRGDRGRIKQILNNLLHNAIKFTKEGNVSIRAWAKKRSLENSVIASNNVGMWKCLSWFSYKHNEAYSDLNALHAIQHQTSVEFVIEVDDTGKGIPKEKRISVFENFVQVKENALEQGGTGLGLGIVQSLVRLMGGDIKIEDKKPGERGTCFRFNIILSTLETPSTTVVGDGMKLLGDQSSSELWKIIWNQVPRPQGSYAVLLIQGDERRRVLQKFMQSLGITIEVLSQLEHLFPTLEKIKHKLCPTHLSPSGQSEFGSLHEYKSDYTSRDFNAETVDLPMDHISPLHRKTSSKSGSGFILIVIDFSVDCFTEDEFSEVCFFLSNFGRDLHDSQCKVVWLCAPSLKSELRRADEKMLAQCEHIVVKPFHGSRLYRLLGLLPEFGGTLATDGYIIKPKEQIAKPPSDPGPSTELTLIRPGSEILKSHHQHDEASSDKPLNGKKVLVVEHGPVFRMVAMHYLSKFGASVEFCENGEEAVEQACRILQKINQPIQEASQILPYDYILMDCQMPIMDGYEATRQIRMEERNYGVHIPIVAMSADASSEEKAKSALAGMDFHLRKPLDPKMLLKAIRCIDGNEHV